MHRKTIGRIGVYKSLRAPGRTELGAALLWAGERRDIEMRYLSVFSILVILLLAGCVDQKDNPTDPDQSANLSPSHESSDHQLALPPHVIPTDQGNGAVEAIVIPEDPEATYDPLGERIKVYTDFESFNEATGELTALDFSSLPPYGSSCPGPQGYEDSIPNPLTIGGVIYEDPWCLESDYCSDPSCPGGGTVLFVHRMATIDFPQSTHGVMISVEGVGDDWFSLRAEDWTGIHIAATSYGIPYGTRFLGFTSSAGIARILVVGAENGILILRRTFYEGP